MHVVWDWNGTLVDDLPIVVECVNAALGEIGEAPIDADDYRKHFARPVHRFYDSLLQRTIQPAEWETLDRTFHEAYAASLDRVPLTEGATRAITAVRERGWTQSILSMWWEDELTACVNRRGIAGSMELVQGNRTDGGGTKAAHLAEHLETLGLTPSTVALIGDAVDDAAAAGAVGAQCVLYDGGSHDTAELVRTGRPVVASLVAAVEMITGGG